MMNDKVTYKHTFRKKKTFTHFNVMYIDHDQLFYLVYEKVKYDEESLEPHLWTYRSRITLEHLRQTLQEKKMRDKHPILHEFLQAVRYVNNFYSGTSEKKTRW